MKARLVFFFALGGLLGCHQRLSMQPDHGRAYTEAFAIQADLDRPSVRQADYPLSGEEGLALRSNVRESTADQEEGVTVSTSGSLGE